MDDFVASLFCILTPKSFGSLKSYSTCRQIVNVLVAVGFIIIYATQINMEVVFSEANHAKDAFQTTSDAEITCSIATTIKVPQFTKEQQNVLRNGFLLGLGSLPLLGGRFAEVIGSRLVIGYSMLGVSALTLLTPIAADCGFFFLLWIRIATGCILGNCIPAFFPLITKWIPNKYRSRFMVHLMLYSLVNALGVPLFGVVINMMDWIFLFYICGIAAFVWSWAWLTLIYDTPMTHPLIPDTRKENIDAQHMSCSISKNPLPVPVYSLMTSIPVWSLIISHTMNEFSQHMLSRYAWNFFDKFTTPSESAFMLTMSQFGQYIFVIIAATIADTTIEEGIAETTLVRKIMTAIGMGFPCILMLIQSFTVGYEYLSVALYTTTTVINGFVVGGIASNVFDIAPNFSGTIIGIANTSAVIARIAATWMFLDLDYDDVQTWQTLFMVISVAYAAGLVVFLVGGSGKIQEWQKGLKKPLLDVGFLNYE